MPDVTDVPDAVVVERGIVFAEKDGYRFLELDVHRPADASRPLPVLHQIHGGGWRVSHRGRAPRETRAWSPTFFERMVAAGFVVVASSYRYSGEAHYPAAVEDSLDAVRWIRAHIADHGGDPSRQVVFGQSAGGYLAAAVGLSREIEPVDGVVCWYPLTDPGAIADDDPAADFPRDWLGATLSTIPAVTAAASLPAQAHRGAPPFLIQHGTHDTMAPVDQGRRLHTALVAAGAASTFEPVEGAEHFFGGCDDVAVNGLFARAMAFARACAAA
jgi:acetyl esterase/lipase